MNLLINSILKKRDKKVKTAQASIEELDFAKAYIRLLGGKIWIENNTVTIIAQTAFGLNGDKAKAIEAGCTDYISKPISQATFERMIHTHFNNRY